MEPAGTVIMPGCVGIRNGVRGAKVMYETIYRIVPMNLCPTLPTFVDMELAFNFI